MCFPVTKAGVHTNKIFVGLSSYGRSSKNVDPDCSSPDCTFVGPDSEAAKGFCTGTAGYLANAEILDTIFMAENVAVFEDESDSDMMTYGGNRTCA